MRHKISVPDVLTESAAPTTPRKTQDACKLSQSLQSLISTDMHHAKDLKIGIAKLAKYGEQRDADLEIETFRHQQLRTQVKTRAQTAKQDRRVLTKARVITHSDVVRLRAEKEAQTAKVASGSKKRKTQAPNPASPVKRKRVRDPSPTESEAEDSENHSSSESDMEEIIVEGIRGTRVSRNYGQDDDVEDTIFVGTKV